MTCAVIFFKATNVFFCFFKYLNFSILIHYYYFFFLKYELKPPMPSKTMRNIVTQIKKLRETMETVLSEQQLEVCKEKIFCFYISLYPGSASLYRSKNKNVGRNTLKFQFQFFSTKDSIKIFVR